MDRSKLARTIVMGMCAVFLAAMVATLVNGDTSQGLILGIASFILAVIAIVTK